MTTYPICSAAQARPKGVIDTRYLNSWKPYLVGEKGSFCCHIERIWPLMVHVRDEEDGGRLRILGDKLKGFSCDHKFMER